MDPAVERFAQVAATTVVDLDVAALTIGAGADPGLDPAPWLEELDRLAFGVDGVEQLVHRLFVERGFTGNVGDDAYPDHSFLHRVLQRRVGLPISLGVVMIEVGRRAGLALEGVGMPGRFLVRDTAGGVLLDPFDLGITIDLPEAERRFRAVTGAGPEVPFGSRLLPGVGPHQILDRMLANLVVVYGQLGRPDEVEWVLRMRLVLPTAGSAAVRALGEALASQGRHREGAEEIESRAGDDPNLHAAARALRARLN